MKVHLVDGTYELFRYFFALPSHVTDDGREVAAVRGVVGSVLSLFEDGATHVGVATDHVISERYPPPEMPEGRQPKGLYPVRIDSEFGASRGPIDCLACHY